MGFLNAKTPFVFDPGASDNTYADYERMRAEGWFALEAVTIDEASRHTTALNISEALNRAAEVGEEPADYDNEVAFIEPRSAIEGLRLALRALIAADNAITGSGYAVKRAREEIQRATLGIGNALVTVESPD